jgi:hypothetical protein
VAHQRPTARLGTRERLEVAVERPQLAVDVRDDGQRDGDLALRGRRELKRGELLVGVAPIEPGDGEAHAVVKEHGVDALQPLGALVDERLAQPHQCAQLEDVFGRDPPCGSRRSISKSRKWRASRLSVLARRFGPRAAVVSAGSAS